jgi:CheY-like chemotaxis protein
MDDLTSRTSPQDQQAGPPPVATENGTNLVVVVSGSRVTSIVVSRIVERTGLKCACVTEAELDEVLANSRPAAIILDDEPQTGSRIADHRRAAGQPGAWPTVILLATNGPVQQAGRDSAHIDAIVAKPITVDNLQPLLFDLRARLRD